jgi:ubiquitin-associated and SH3 domain-containing protein
VPYSKQLHLTLAYNFDAEHKRSLEELAIQHIDYRAKSEWEIRLYSRDSRADSKYVILQTLYTLYLHIFNKIKIQ